MLFLYIGAVMLGEASVLALFGMFGVLSDKFKKPLATTAIVGAAFVLLGRFSGGMQ